MFRSTLPALFVLFLLPASLSTTLAQPVYRQSWTMQEKEFGLRQDLARYIIRNANDYLTRDDPNGPVARLDDRLRVTVVGELAPSSGLVQNRLERLVMGTVVVDRNFDAFLDAPTVSRIVRRDYFWRDESIEIFNERLSPILRSVVDSSLLQGRRWEFNSVDEAVPPLRLAADESLVRLDAVNSLFAGIGNEALSLPMFTYGRARVGIRRGDLRAWCELPAPVGDIGKGMLVERGLDSRFGLGMSFESRWANGMIAGTFGETTYGPDATGSGIRYVMNIAGRVQAVLPLRLPGDLAARLKAGVGYRSLDALTARMPRQDPLAGDQRFVVSGEIDLRAFDDHRRPSWQMKLGLFDQSLMLTSELSSIIGPLGVRFAVSKHGIFGRRDPWLPSYSFSILPTLTLW